MMQVMLVAVWVCVCCMTTYCHAWQPSSPLRKTLLTSNAMREGKVMRAASQTRISSLVEHTCKRDYLASKMQLRASTSDEDDESQNGLFATIGTIGLVSNAVVAFSLYVLKTTSCGLPPGPYGLLGAAEGISYLVVVATFLWSVATKIKTGKGLPAGPNGLLGASEGLTFLSILAGIVIAVLNYNEFGFLPGFFPDGKCYG